MIDNSTNPNFNVSTQNSEDLLKIFNLSPDLICIAKPDGYFSRINPAWEKVLGFSLQEVMDLGYAKLVHPDDVKPTMDEVAKQLKGSSTVNFINRYKCKDGTYKFIEWQATSAPDGILYAIGRDITNRKENEKELQETEVLYKTIFETSADAIMTLEPPDWRFTRGNKTALNMFMAKDEAEFEASEPWQLSPEKQPDGRLSSEKAKEMIDIAMRNGSNFFEWTHRRLSGQDFQANVLLTRITLLGKTFLQATVRDISEIKKNDQALILSKIIIDESIDGIISANNKGEITFFNKAAEEMFGVSSSEVLGKSLSVIMPEKYRDLHAAGIDRYLSTHVPKEIGNITELEGLRKDGTVFSMEMSLSAQKTSQSQDSFTAIIRDISQRKKAEVDLKEKVAELERVNHIMVDRELKMVELKQQVADLEAKLAQKA